MGMSILLRPDRKMLERLTGFAAEAAEVAGGGHWAHGPELLHVSLRALQEYRDEVDPAGYAEALARAAKGLPMVRAQVRTVSPHPIGVGVHVHPEDDTLDVLYRRVAQELGGLGGFETWSRDIWYTNIVHFAGPVRVEDLVGWCDERRDVHFGTTAMHSVEIVRYRFDGVGMIAETLSEETLGAH